MRVLYLCHRIPYPPNKGDKIRAFHEIRALAARHEVDVYTLADDAGDLAYKSSLEQHCRRVTVARTGTRWARLRVLPYLLSKTPLTVPYFYSSELEDQVRKALTSGYDRLFVYCSAMMQYVESAVGVPVIADLVDADSDKWAQYAQIARFPHSAVYRREARLLGEYERRICETAAVVVVTTDREASVLRGLAPGCEVQVIPNGVDTDFFDPAAVPPTIAGPPAVIFTGDMSYFPNEEAVVFYAREVLPLVRQLVPDTRFLIVGRNPGPKVKELERMHGVEVTGFVPDVRTYLARSRVAVAPFRIAAGIQNKILEALAYGLPVVATPRAAQGLAPLVRGLVETGETAKELAAKTVVLLLDPALASRAGMTARTQLSLEYRWDCAMERLVDLVENLSPTSSKPALQGWPWKPNCSSLESRNPHESGS